MRTLALLLLVLVSSARAQDSLLERLGDEMRRIVVRAEGAVVELAGTHVSLGLVPTGQQPGTYVITSGISRRVGVPTHGLRLRSKYLALPASAGGVGRTVTVSLAGKQENATVAFSDADLGIAIATLPEGQGLSPESDWAKLQPGTLAVAYGETPSLVMISGCSRSAARVEVEGAPGEAEALLGPGGTLLALRVAAPRGTRFAVAVPAATAALTQALALQQGEARLAEWQRANQAWAAAQGTAFSFLSGPLIHRLLADLDEFGRVRSAFVGVVAGDVKGKGIVLSRVLAGSPAERAGLKHRDIVVSVNGEVCESASDLSRVLSCCLVGEVIEVELSDGRRVSVTTEDRATSKAAPATADALGLDCVDLTPDLRRWLGLEAATEGVLVRGVTKGSPAAEAGIRRGDVIQRGGESAIRSLDELNAAVGGARGSITVTCWRDIETFDAEVRLPESRLGAGPR